MLPLFSIQSGIRTYKHAFMVAIMVLAHLYAYFEACSAGSDPKRSPQLRMSWCLSGPLAHFITPLRCSIWCLYSFVGAKGPKWAAPPGMHSCTLRVGPVSGPAKRTQPTEWIHKMVTLSQRQVWSDWCGVCALKLVSRSCTVALSIDTVGESTA